MLEMEQENVLIKVYPEDNCKVVNFYVECFDRWLVILFQNVTNADIVIIENQLEEIYQEWLDDAKCQCCEETMINELDSIYRNNILATMSIENREDDENE